MVAKTKKRRSNRPTLSTEEKLKLAKSKIHPIGHELKYLNACVYGKNGKGKTTFGASGPKAFIVDCNEKNTGSARGMGAYEFRVETWEDIDLAYWFLKSGKHEYETVVIDTVSSLATLCMKFVLGDEAARDATRDPDMPDKRHWFKVTELMKTVILNFRNLPMHTIFLAQERRGFSEDDEDESVEIYPDLSASARATLLSHVTIIGRIYTVPVKVAVPGKKKKRVVKQHRLRVGDLGDGVAAKVNIRNHGLPDVIVDPDFSKILAHINKRVKAKKKTAKKKGAK